MSASTNLTSVQAEITLVKLAREIAMDIQPIETILHNYSISPGAWESLQRSSNFIRLLSSQVEEWNGALNTHERVKLKAASMLEEFLPELNNRMHDKEESLPAKIEGAKLVTKIAGIGERAEGLSAGERFTVTINLGEDTKLITIDKVMPLTIDHDAAE